MNEPNTLEQFVAEIGMDPIEAANLLTEAGIIADNAVTLHDVCETDCVRAIKFLDGLV
jgi:hypothetical protein